MNIIETAWNWNGNLTTRKSTDYIVLHHAEASHCTAQDIDSWHKGNTWLGIGYHFFVRKDGTIYRGRPQWAQGSHVLGKNNISLGICAEGAYNKEIMPDEQKRAIAELINYLKTEYYPNAKIVGHREIGESDCPGRNYPLDELKNYKSILKEDAPMTADERKKFNAAIEAIETLSKKIDELSDLVNKLNNPMIYNYIDDNMPIWAREAVQSAVDKRIIKGEGDGLGLTYSDLRTIVREHRAGLY